MSDSASQLYVDTHVLVWLAAARHRLSPKALGCLRTAECVYISPMVELELQYLYEIGRLRLDASGVLSHIQQAVALMRCDKALAEVIRVTKHLTWTRDPFDRLIVAQCAVNHSTLITSDATILAHYPHAVWE